MSFLQDKALRILFICTHNRCRSILAEAVTNHVWRGLLRAASAGSKPAGAVYPMTLKSLERHGIPVTGLHSKSWDEVEDFEPDIVITVCDNAAGELCPVWFGKSLKVHWNLSDPSTVQGSKADKEAAFDQTIKLLTDRINSLCTLLETDPDRTSIIEVLQSMESRIAV